MQDSEMVEEKRITSMHNRTIEQGSDVKIDIIEIKQLLDPSKSTITLKNL